MKKRLGAGGEGGCSWMSRRVSQKDDVSVVTGGQRRSDGEAVT